MNRILVFTEPTVESIKKITLGILEKLDGYETEVAIIGELEQSGIDLIKRYNVKRFISLKGNSIQDFSPEAYTNALQNFIKDNHYDVIFSGATSIAQDVFPRLSAIFRTGFASGVKDFFFKNGYLFGIKETYGGKYLVDIELLGPKPWFMTIKPGTLNVSTRSAYHDYDIVDFNVLDCDIHAQVYEIEENVSQRPPLDNADIVVAGGRGLGDETSLNILEELADALGAALGASGGAIGSDFAPQDCLVGQTGAQISPLLYIACGISGAVQHLAGIRNAKRILAINSDANAPLMKMADYAIIGDLHDIVPAITKQLSVKRHDDLVE
jgi:electron transfer flavoprotein alpha subunit